MNNLPRILLASGFGLARLGLTGLALYGLFALYIFFQADNMIFLPRPASYQDNEDILKIPVSEDTKISATYLPNPDADLLLLYMHGNAEDLGDIRPLLERLHTWGFSVFAYDYQGYGTSDGSPSERNAYQEAEAVYRYLTQQLQIPPEQIVPYGRSVGGGPATHLAARRPVGGLILASTFTSVFRVVVPFPLLPFDKFPNLHNLQQVRSPVLIMHGKADRTIPLPHGQALYDAAPDPKLFLWVDGADHNDFTWVAGKQHPETLLAFQALVTAP